MQSITELHGLRNQAQPRGAPRQCPLRPHSADRRPTRIYPKGMGKATDLEVAFENKYPLVFNLRK